MKIGDQVYLVADHLNSGGGAPGEITSLCDSTAEIAVRLTESEAVLNVKTWEVLPAKVYIRAVLYAVYGAAQKLEQELGSMRYVDPQAITKKLVEYELSPQTARQCMELFDSSEWKSSPLRLCQWLKRIRDFYYQKHRETVAA
jgi:hypothetical protein